MKKLIIAAGLTLLFLTDSVLGQKKEYMIERISLEEGLSQSAVNTIYQDKKGFLWFGTQDGLNRYDGYGFTVYKSEPGNPNSLSNNWISSLFEDAHGNIWIGTQGGLNKLSGDKITYYQNDPSDSASLPQDIIISIFGDNFGRIWAGTQDQGLCVLDVKTEKFTSFKHDTKKPNSISDDRVYAVIVDQYQTLWVGTRNGLNKMELSGEIKENFQTVPVKKNDPKGLSDNRIFALHEDKSRDVLWIGTLRG